MTTLGDRLRHFRKLAVMTRAELASALGYKEGRGLTTIRSWETGRSEPRRGIVRKIAEIFMVDAAEIEGIPRKLVAGTDIAFSPAPLGRPLYNDAPSTLGQRIKYFRTCAGLSQVALAAKVGFEDGKGQTTIALWERDRTEPGREQVREIAEVLNADLADLEGFTACAVTWPPAAGLDANHSAPIINDAGSAWEHSLIASAAFVASSSNIAVTTVPAPQVDRNETAIDQHVELVVDRLERLVQFLRAQNFNRQDPGALTTRQVILLNCIAGNPGISVNELAALTYLDQTSITSMLRRMEARDLTMRKYSPRDGRCREIYATETGLGRLQLAQTVPVNTIRDALGRLPSLLLADLERGLGALMGIANIGR